MHHDQLFPRCCPVQTPDRFGRFQRLPPEIRNMIWEFALPEPRVYEVLDAPNAKQKTPAQEGLMFANMHPEPPPALAAVCRESRYFVLHHYKPLTLGKTTKFVDMSRDILLLEPYLLVKRLHRALHFMSQIPLVRENATRLALGTSYGIYPGIFHPVLGRKVSKNNMGKLLASLAKFPRLRTLIFVVHQEFQFEFDFRFPGTLTPMPLAPMAGSIHAGLGPLCRPTLEPIVHPSPTATSGAPFSNCPPKCPIPATLTTIRDGLPSPANSATTSPLPQPYVPLPSFSAPSQQQQSPPPPPPLPLQIQPLHIQQQPSPPLQTPRQQRPHASLQPTLLPTTTGTSTSTLALAPAPRPQQQQVHQAYRFKFDIEANINSPPRRPHSNEFLYYPLPDARAQERDEFDEYECYVNGSRGASSVESELGLGGGWDRSTVANVGAGGGDASDGEDEGEWCDPWPTNDDWRRFRRRWVRGMVAACLPAAGAGEGGRDGRAGEEGEMVRGAAGKACGRGGKGPAGKGGEERICLPKWKLKGASLLWRYTRGVGGVQ
ncbi:hypothetical protein F5144DRAFT_40857 [Chaetomium tenue]|uniref:Uncharacterized protein n=1 Tax=Chaetomium tenue TaxID=1854479 RepID=A0ACB7PM55_9PEZI|nr:hypothetical protein F5144DRAFT_40857 [Chaetomium globosum]